MDLLKSKIVIVFLSYDSSYLIFFPLSYKVFESSAILQMYIWLCIWIPCYSTVVYFTMYLNPHLFNSCIFEYVFESPAILQLYIWLCIWIPCYSTAVYLTMYLNPLLFYSCIFDNVIIVRMRSWKDPRYGIPRPP